MAIPGQLSKYQNPTPGTYIKTKLLMNNNPIHAEKLKKCTYNYRCESYLEDIEITEKSICLTFLIKVPEFLRKDSTQFVDGKHAVLYQDLTYLVFDGKVETSLDYVNIEYDLPELGEFYDPTWTYPYKCLDHLINFLDHLAIDSLTEGFDESLLIGPEYITIGE